MYIPVDEDLNKCIKMNKEISEANKNSLTLFGIKSFTDLVMMIPYGLAKHVLFYYS